MPQKRILTQSERKWLVSHYKHTKNDDIQKRLGICKGTLHRLAREYGLKKSKQFMRKVATENSMLAWKVNRANNWPPKGYKIPRSDEFCMKPGEALKDRVSPKRWKEMCEKRRLTWLANRKRDRARFVFGFDQKTKHRFVVQSRSKVCYRSNMKKKGYIVDVEKNVFCYTSEQMRRPTAERNGAKYGITFRPISDYED